MICCCMIFKRSFLYKTYFTIEISFMIFGVRLLFASPGRKFSSSFVTPTECTHPAPIASMLATPLSYHPTESAMQCRQSCQLIKFYILSSNVYSSWCHSSCTNFYIQWNKHVFAPIPIKIALRLGFNQRPEQKHGKV